MKIRAMLEAKRDEDAALAVVLEYIMLHSSLIKILIGPLGNYAPHQSLSCRQKTTGPS